MPLLPRTSWLLLCALLVARGAQAAPVITEIFYNPPGSSEVEFEWFEIYNPGPGDLDISGLVVDSRSASSPRLATVPAGTAPIPQGSFAVLAKSALLGVTCRTAGPTVVLEGSFALNNSNDAGADNPRLALFAAGTVDVVNTAPLDVVAYREGGFATVDGTSLMLVDLGADNYLSASWVASPGAGAGCQPYATNTSGSLHGSPGRPNDWCYRGPATDAGAVEDAAPEDGSVDAGVSAAEPVCLTGGFDAGVVDSAGVADAGPGVDASLPDAALPDLGSIDLGPQNPPTIALGQPASAVTASPAVDIAWTASDPDGDAVSVALFYDDDGSGNEGVLIADSLPAQGSHRWQPGGVEAGTYRVFGRALDARGGLAYAYAAGTVSVPPAAVEQPILRIVTPTGSEGEVAGPVDIAFTHNDIPGTIDLFYDVDQAGHDGQPIIGGLAVPGGPTRVQWNTDEVPAGTYYVHGRYQTAVGLATAYSPGAVTVVRTQEGCGCRSAAAPCGAVGLAGPLAFFLLRRRRPTAWR